MCSDNGLTSPSRVLEPRAKLSLSKAMSMVRSVPYRPSLGIGPGFLTDWLEHDANSIFFWHPGMAPLDMCNATGCEDAPTLGGHFNGARPFVVDGQLQLARGCHHLAHLALRRAISLDGVRRPLHPAAASWLPATACWSKSMAVKCRNASNASFMQAYRTT